MDRRRIRSLEDPAGKGDHGRPNRSHPVLLAGVSRRHDCRLYLSPGDQVGRHGSPADGRTLRPGWRGALGRYGGLLSRAVGGGAHQLVPRTVYVASAPGCRNRSRCNHRGRSEEHTSELQSHSDLVCRLLLEKKKKIKKKKIKKSQKK